jgi:hypothetical protein
MRLFAGNGRLRAAVRSRARLTHGTVVAYVALFFALGGSGYAATQLGGHSKGAPVAPVAHAARGSKLKVHCTATNGGKKVKCVAVTGVVRGPQGPQGPPGPKGAQGIPGKNGTSTTGSSGGGGGTTVFVQPPAYAIGNEAPSPASCSTGTNGFSGSGAPSQYDQTQAWSASSTCASGNGYATTNIYYRATGVAASESATFTTYLQTPSQVDGSPSDLDSVQFCYGDANDTAGTGNEAQTATMTINRAQVYEIDEPAVATAGGGAPPYKHELLLNDALSLTGGSNCATVKPSSTATVDPSGYLLFRIFAAFNATKGYYANSYAAQQAYTAVTPLTLGRITTTYGP